MDLTTVSLRREASAEVQRLTTARALLRDGDEPALLRLEGEPAWIAVSSRGRVRRALQGRLCAVWRVSFEDASGRVIESKVVPVLLEVSLGANRRSSAWIRSILQQTDVLVRGRVEAECATWSREVVRVFTSFSSARQVRQRDIGPGTAGGERLSQQGLFDRRVERSRRARESAAAESERTAADRLRAAAAAAAIEPQPPRLLLVLAV
jgi:hypothetical protein